MNTASLYIHVPFCTRKCAYCHFYVLPDKDPLKAQLMEGLHLEWQAVVPLLRDKRIESLYFGGGTPFLLGPDKIAEIISWLNQDGMEITLEANPENITPGLATAYAQAGVNRMSIGIQSLDNSLLQILGRLHDARKAEEAVHIVHASGIHNISVDLMYDLPSQSLEHWENTLQRVSELPITHLSLYNLTIEPHTVFFKYRNQLQKQLPDEETSLAMYNRALAVLEQAGLQRYEISAFAKPSFESRHNSGYWIARPFLGLGPSAFSYWEGRRFQNVANLSKYHKMLLEGKSPIGFEEKLESEAARRELLAIRIRLACGVDLQTFQATHGPIDTETRAALQDLEKQDLISSLGNIRTLTHKGILFYDTVASELV